LGYEAQQAGQPQSCRREIQRSVKLYRGGTIPRQSALNRVIDRSRGHEKMEALANRCIKKAKAL